MIYSRERQQGHDQGALICGPANISKPNQPCWGGSHALGQMLDGVCAPYPIARGGLVLGALMFFEACFTNFGFAACRGEGVEAVVVLVDHFAFVQRQHVYPLGALCQEQAAVVAHVKHGAKPNIPRILGFLDSWILGFLDSWILGFLDSAARLSIKIGTRR